MVRELGSQVPHEITGYWMMGNKEKGANLITLTS